MEPDFNRLIVPDYNVLHDKLVDVVAGQLNYFEKIDSIDMQKATADEIIEMNNGSTERYQNDYIFKAKVISMVAQLLHAVREEQESRLSAFDGKRIEMIEP